jgi:hypothetical protein
VGILPFIDITGVKSYKGTLPGIEEEKTIRVASRGTMVRPKSKPATKLVLSNAKRVSVNHLTNLHRFKMSSGVLQN